MQPIYSVGAQQKYFVSCAMDSLGSRLRTTREGKNLSQAALAKIVGLNQQTIDAIENGRTTNPRKLEQIAAALDVTPEFLRFGVNNVVSEPGAHYTLSPGAVTEKRYAFIPRYDVVASAGEPRASDGHEEVSGMHAYRRDWLERRGLMAGACAVIEVEGDSMHPTVSDGDVVLVNMAEKKLRNGEVFAFRTSDGPRIKRLFKTMDGRIRVASDNPDKISFPDEWLTPGMEAEIIGRVVHRSGGV